MVLGILPAYVNKADSKTSFLAQLSMALAPIRIGRDTWWGLPFIIYFFSPCSMLLHYVANPKEGP